MGGSPGERYQRRVVPEHHRGAERAPCLVRPVHEAPRRCRLMAKWQPRKGKKTGQHFVRLDHYVLDSDAYLALSATARVALVEICRRYDGFNNGRIAVSAQHVAERLGMSKGHRKSSAPGIGDRGFYRHRQGRHLQAEKQDGERILPDLPSVRRDAMASVEKVLEETDRDRNSEQAGHGFKYANFGLTGETVAPKIALIVS